MPRLIIAVEVPEHELSPVFPKDAAEIIVDVYNEQQQQHGWPTATVVSARWEN